MVQSPWSGPEGPTEGPTAPVPVPVSSFQGRKDVARGGLAGTTSGPGPGPTRGRRQRLDPFGTSRRRGGPGGHHVHRGRAVRQDAPHVARVGRDRRPHFKPTAAGRSLLV